MTFGSGKGPGSGAARPPPALIASALA
jgi:hypothetical protein